MTVRHAQQIDCGGGYIKLLPKDVDQDTFNGDASYYVMFGPDICGTNRKVHVIWIYKETNFMLKKDIPVSYDTITHCYTLVVKPDQTYEVLIDMKKVAFGGLTEDWDILPPNKIKDPKAQKPADYVDEKEIDDVEDKKPVDWDVPEFLADSEDTKPDTWDDEMDGEWKPTQKKNPAYKGEWKPRRVKNPDYQGPWVAPLIDNPDYFTDDSIYVLKNIGAVGFDLWQVKSGTMFDNILITDDLEYAKKVAAENWEPLYNKEKEEMEEQSRIRREEFEKEQQSRKEGAAANSAKDAAEDAAENADSEDTESKEEL
jgi:calreticulin